MRENTQFRQNHRQPPPHHAPSLPRTANPRAPSPIIDPVLHRPGPLDPGRPLPPPRRRPPSVLRGPITALEQVPGATPQQSAQHFVTLRDHRLELRAPLAPAQGQRRRRPPPQRRLRPPARIRPRVSAKRTSLNAALRERPANQPDLALNVAPDPGSSTPGSPRPSIWCSILTTMLNAEIDLDLSILLASAPQRL